MTLGSRPPRRGSAPRSGGTSTPRDSKEMGLRRRRGALRHRSSGPRSGKDAGVPPYGTSGGTTRSPSRARVIPGHLFHSGEESAATPVRQGHMGGAHYVDGDSVDGIDPGTALTRAVVRSAAVRLRERASRQSRSNTRPVQDSIVSEKRRPSEGSARLYEVGAVDRYGARRSTREQASAKSTSGSKGKLS